MDSWIEWARGPFFVFCFSFMVLGLSRHVALTIWEIVKTLKRAGDKSLPYTRIALATLTWLFPVGRIRDSLFYSVTSVVFHLAVIIVPLFLAGHIALWTRGTGLVWPAIPHQAADVLTVAAVTTAVLLFVQRLAAKETRALSRFQDFALPLLIALPFASGFLMMHPTINPFSFQATFFVHIMSANLIFVAAPLSKLSHMALFPGSQLVSELAWKWPRDAGSKVAVALGKEKEPI